MMQANDTQALDRAFEALARSTEGDGGAWMVPIETAVQTARTSPAARTAIEQRLLAHLAPAVSRPGRTFVCRQLALIGSSAAVPALAALLTDHNMSHPARYALERIPGPEVDAALRDAIQTTAAAQKIGVLHSIGVRRDNRSVPQLTALLADGNVEVAAAAAAALGRIGSAESAAALGDAQGRGGNTLRLALADAALTCADLLTRAGNRDEALRLLDRLQVPANQPHIELAARRARSVAMRH